MLILYHWAAFGDVTDCGKILTLSCLQEVDKVRPITHDPSTVYLTSNAMSLPCSFVSAPINFNFSIAPICMDAIRCV